MPVCHRRRSSPVFSRSAAGPDRGDRAPTGRPRAAVAGSIVAAAAAVGIAAAPAVAFAHAGHGIDLVTGFAASLAAGLAHPFSGVDHLLAMLAVGAWVTHGARRSWVVPAAGVVALLIGFALASIVPASPGLEVGVAASLLVVGGLLVARTAPRAADRSAPGNAAGNAARKGSAGAWAPVLVGACTLLHGVAHGQAFAGVAPFVATATGLALGSALIVAAGAFAARGIDRVWAPRFIGATAAVVGVVSFAGLAA